MLLKCYIVVLLTTAIDEQWNINNPRPNPIKTYKRLQWEKADFFTYKINNEWVLRPYRKTDTKLKKKVRKKYWAKRAKLQK
tara:strand:- start:130 stop:372 length:243 start_codon:yes stop_codon:yes gene_type:complete